MTDPLPPVGTTVPHYTRRGRLSHWPEEVSGVHTEHRVVVCRDGVARWVLVRVAWVRCNGVTEVWQHPRHGCPPPQQEDA